MNWQTHGPLENILVSFYEQASTEIWTHSRAAQQYLEIDKCFSVPRIILSGLISGAALVLEYVKDPQYKSYALIGIAGIGAINSLFGSVQLYVNAGSLSGTHRQISEAWAALARDISLVLRKEIKDRPEGQHFLSDVQSTFSRLTESSPPIPSNIIKAFKKENSEWIQNHEVAIYLNGLHELDVWGGSDGLTETHHSSPRDSRPNPDDLLSLRNGVMETAAQL
jgi:hypothetical protein